MRIVYVDHKCSIKEPETSYPSLVDAVAALDNLFREGLSSFGQVLAPDGAVLKNLAPSLSPRAESQENTANAA